MGKTYSETSMKKINAVTKIEMPRMLELLKQVELPFGTPRMLGSGIYQTIVFPIVDGHALTIRSYGRAVLFEKRLAAKGDVAGECTLSAGEAFALFTEKLTALLTENKLIAPNKFNYHIF